MIQQKFRRGIYETEYGNTAYVSGPNAKYAFDLDSAQRIPIALVTFRFVREATSFDKPSAYKGY